MISRALFITMIVLLIAVVALGIYGLHMKHQAELATPLGPEAKPVTAPVNGSTAVVALFIPNDFDGVLVRSDVSISVPADPSGRAREILRALVTACQAKDSTHPLPPDADIRDVFLPSANLASHQREFCICRRSSLWHPRRGTDDRCDRTHSGGEHARHQTIQAVDRRQGTRNAGGTCRPA